jgi:hypothetical protein
MTLNRFAGFLIAILYLTACGPTMIISERGKSAVAVNGATLTLHQDITVPQDSARVFFQNGRITAAINEFLPYCQLTVRTLQETPQTIYADSFQVIGVTGDVQKVVRSERVLLASAADFKLADGGGGDGGESPETQVLNMEIRSERQPDVRYFVCGGAFDIPALARRPTLQNIQTAIGSVASFETL